MTLPESELFAPPPPPISRPPSTPHPIAPHMTTLCLFIPLSLHKPFTPWRVPLIDHQDSVDVFLRELIGELPPFPLSLYSILSLTICHPILRRPSGHILTKPKQTLSFWKEPRFLFCCPSPFSVFSALNDHIFPVHPAIFLSLWAVAEF